MGNFSPTTVEDSMTDLQEVLRLTEESSKKSPVAQSCRVMALLKNVHVLTQISAMLGHQISDQEVERVTSYIQEAKRISPMHESVILLDADQLSIHGDIDGALSRCDEVILLSDRTDSIPYVIKANILMQKMLYQMQMAKQNQDGQLMAKAQSTMNEMEGLFTEAINVEPNGVEAFAQYAQLKSMVGDYDLAIANIEKAITNARSKDEVIRIFYVKINCYLNLTLL